MTKYTQLRLPWRITGILILAGSALIGACGSSGGGNGAPATSPASSTPMTSSASPSTSVSVSAAACKHVASLRTSLESLTSLQLNASMQVTIRKDLENIGTQLTALKGEVGGAFSTQASQLNAALNQVTTAAKGLSAPPTTAQIQAITTALTNLKAKSKAMLTEMDAVCPKQ